MLPSLLHVGREYRALHNPRHQAIPPSPLLASVIANGTTSLPSLPCGHHTPNAMDAIPVPSRTHSAAHHAHVQHQHIQLSLSSSFMLMWQRMILPPHCSPAHFGYPSPTLSDLGNPPAGEDALTGSNKQDGPS